MNLNELWHYDDAVDAWAAATEFELRGRRYETWRSGGLIGAMHRFTDILRGDPDYGHTMDIRIYDDGEPPITNLYERLQAIEDRLANERCS